MDAITMLQTRRSCKKYGPGQISEEDLNTILSCGLNAPSAGNRQDPVIIVIRDKETIDDLARLNAAVMGKTGIDPFYGATTLCLIVTNTQEAYGTKDGALVIGAMQDAAFALGVGSAWIDRCTEMLASEEGRKYLEKWGMTGYYGVGCCVLGVPAAEPNPKEIKEGRIVRV